MSLKLISINVERSKHLDLVVPFFEKEQADVVCVQELMRRDLPLFEEVLGPAVFTPVVRHAGDEDEGEEGNAVFTKLPVLATAAHQYVGASGPFEDYNPTDGTTKHATRKDAVTSADVEAPEGVYRIATTHFTWTPDGKPDAYQREDIQKVLDILRALGEFAFCGDLNAPRGGEIFAYLANRYADAIPAEYQTSIDINLHRSGKKRPEDFSKLMVDGLFTTPGYVASNVRLVSGVSDHCAIVAEITKSK